MYGTGPEGFGPSERARTRSSDYKSPAFGHSATAPILVVRTRRDLNPRPPHYHCGALMARGNLSGLARSKAQGSF